ncbi:hypothetical protein Nmel_007747 [Mimus melanotis]
MRERDSRLESLNMRYVCVYTPQLLHPPCLELLASGDPVPHSQSLLETSRFRGNLRYNMT